MSYTTIDALRSQLGRPASSSAYAEKMLHRIPDAPVVDREAFVLSHCRGERVVEFGASGALHIKIVEVAAAVLGVDLVGEDVVRFDLDDVTQPTLPGMEFEPTVVVCAEVIEHLANPGWFLTRVRRQWPHLPVIITVPNAFSEIGRRHLRTGVENVNRDHCWWPSYRTLKTLLAKSGFAGFSFGWYHGSPLTAEGLVLICEGAHESDIL